MDTIDATKSSGDANDLLQNSDEALQAFALLLAQLAADKSVRREPTTPVGVYEGSSTDNE